MIEARGLTRSFGGREVVRDVSFAVAPGEVVGVLGPNGAGKTTTVRMLLGLIRPSSGEAHLGGRCGYLPEVFAAYDALTTRAYLRFMARVKCVGRDEVDRAASRAGVADLLQRPVGRLSKGQRQRVGVAQALLGHPSVYVLDEPTQGLDPGQVVETRETVRSLATSDGAAVLFSTHVIAEAAAVCDRVVVIARGRVLADERPGDAGALEQRFLDLVREADAF